MILFKQSSQIRRRWSRNTWSNFVGRLYEIITETKDDTSKYDELILEAKKIGKDLTEGTSSFAAWKKKYAVRLKALKISLVSKKKKEKKTKILRHWRTSLHLKRNSTT